MPDLGYIAAAVAAAVAVTVTLRAVPFAMKARLRTSPMLMDLGRLMPLGAVAVLATNYLAGINVTAAEHGLPELSGVVATVMVHLWRRNAVLSIVAGTGVCLALANIHVT